MRLVAPYRARQSWTGFHALVEAFYVSRAAFLAQRLRRLHRCVRKRGVGGKPEANEQRERLVGQVEVPCEAVELTGNAIKTPAHRRFESIGAVGRQIGRQRRLEDCGARRSEEHTSELQSLMRISYAVFCLKKKQKDTH